MGGNRGKGEAGRSLNGAVQSTGSWSHSGARDQAVELPASRVALTDREGTREIRGVREDQPLTLRDLCVRQDSGWGAEAWDPVPELAVWPWTRT